jgi:hypothetical protein
MSLGSFSADWPARRAFLHSRIGGPTSSTARDLVGLGAYLGEAHRAPAVPGRGQADVSRSGAAWHGLVTYYLNLVFAGTDAVAVTAPFCPSSVKDSMKVSYGGTSVRGDLDVVLLVLPGASTRPEPTAADVDVRRRRAKGQYQLLFNGSFNTAYVALLALKTNWNDAVQSVMLWNLLYTLRAAGGTLPPGLSIGSGGFSLDQLAGFSNAFITVPTNNLSNYTATSMSVQRMRAMSGGYYWGYPTRPGVCSNIAEFLDRQASKSPLVPPPASAGEAFHAEVTTHPGFVDLEAFDWLPAATI